MGDGSTPRKLLIVDDEEWQALPLADFLRERGFDVDVVIEPEKARRRVRGTRYDLALLDIQMSPYDGLDVLVDIRTFSPETPVLMMTAEAGPEKAARAVALGAKGCLERDPGRDTASFVKAIEEALSPIDETLIEYLWGRLQTGPSSRRGRDLEALMKLLFESVPGFDHVKTNERMGTGEEIDVEFENRRDDTFWRDQGAVIRAECKNFASREVGPEACSHFLLKLRTTRSKLGFLVSYSGFTEGVRSKLLTSVDGPLLALVNREGLTRLVRSKDRESVLRAMVRDATRLSAP